jgi:hypothetical protein
MKRYLAALMAIGILAGMASAAPVAMELKLMGKVGDDPAVPEVLGALIYNPQDPVWGTTQGQSVALNTAVWRLDGSAGIEWNLMAPTMAGDFDFDWATYSAAPGSDPVVFQWEGTTQEADNFWADTVAGASLDQRAYFFYGVSENIPEPATMSLLGLGGLLMLRRRRK